MKVTFTSRYIIKTPPGTGVDVATSIQQRFDEKKIPCRNMGINSEGTEVVLLTGADLNEYEAIKGGIDYLSSHAARVTYQPQIFKAFANPEKATVINLAA